MKTSEVSIRDPYILVHEGKYYLYGTRSETCWGPADGFDCYVSSDLENWDGPIEIFHRPEGFFADREYWAPECYYYKEEFYLVTTLASEDRKKGIYVLKSGKPTGPFEVYSDCLTPKDWTCIDGTLWLEEGVPYLIFSHSFEDVISGLDGDFCYIKLSEDLKQPVSDPVTMFTAKGTPWAKPVPFAKAEFGIEEDCYFSDGPSLLKLDDGKLYMILSSWSVNGYAVGVAISDGGKVEGPWRQQEEPLWPENGGHGMFFKDLDGKIIFSLHYPNDKFKERPTFWRVVLEDGKLKLDGKADSSK